MRDQIISVGILSTKTIRIPTFLTSARALRAQQHSCQIWDKIISNRVQKFRISECYYYSWWTSSWRPFFCLLCVPFFTCFLLYLIDIRLCGRPRVDVSFLFLISSAPPPPSLPPPPLRPSLYSRKATSTVDWCGHKK